MKKKSGKKLSLGKITIAGLSRNNQQMVKGGIPEPTAPIICQPTKVCLSNYYVLCQPTRVCYVFM